jgi:pSer/pThr/pTyr-binding forkhead associated (FHA) protein
MSVRLLVRQRSEAGGDKPIEVLLDEEVINLGRDKGCQVVLAQQAVSRNHARISRDGSLYFLEDLGSAYGTQVNGKALPKGEKRLLRNGDVIAIAQFDVTFDRAVERPKVSDDKTSLVARHLVKDVMRGLGSGEGPYFRVMNGPREGEKIEITDAREMIIGREEGVEIVLHDDLVSRKHAKIRRDWSGTHVEDLESRNGIRVNKRRVNRRTLKDRDELEVGGIRLLYLDPTEVREAPVVLPNQEPVPEEVEGEPTNSGLDEEPEESAEPEEAAHEAPAEDDVSPEPEPDAGFSDEPASEDPAFDDAPPDDELPEGMDDAADELDDEPAVPSAGPLGLPKSTLILLGAMALVGLAAISLLVMLFAGV